MTDVESGNEVGIDNTDSSSTPTIVSSSEEVDEIIDDAYMLCSFLFLYGCKITCRWDSWDWTSALGAVLYVAISDYQLLRVIGPRPNPNRYVIVHTPCVFGAIS